MDSTLQNSPVSNKNLWIGCLVSAAPVLMLLLSGVMKIARTEEVVKGFADWPAGSAVAIGIVELACTVLYLIPRTAVLGALLLTAYLGGATAVTVRTGGPFVVPIIFGVLVWGGLYLREPRLRALLPFRR
ncbi:MAG: DoxX family protein [Opitutae bacterium]|nr:DoxX family protein [Opitutae bacterium]